MPDPEGRITAGTDNVIGAPTPVFGMDDALAGGVDTGTSGALSQIGGQIPSASPQAPPTQQPQFFRKLLLSLGQGLIEGTKAGLQAPLSPQGPAIAASTAINAPQVRQQQLTTNQMNALGIAMTQLKLHQLQMMVQQESEGVQSAAYDRGANTAQEFIDKGKGEFVASGDMASVQKEFNRRHTDMQEKGTTLPLYILPAPGSSAKNPKYVLLNMAPGKLTNDQDDQVWGAKEYSDDPAEQQAYKDAGLGEMKFKGAPAGTDNKKALELVTKAHNDWWIKSAAAVSKWKTEQAQIELKKKSLAQQLEEFKTTDAFRKQKLLLDTETKKQVAAMTQNKAPAAVTQTAIFSQGALEQMDDAEQAMDAMDRQGVLGQNPFNNKMEEFLFKNGLADPSWDNNTKRMMGKLRAALGNTATATMRAHTGRTSTEIYDDYKKRFGVGQSWMTLRGAMDETKVLLQHYVDAASDESIKAIRQGGKAAAPSDEKKPAAQGRIRVKLKDGRTGTVNAEDFDAKSMTKVQ